MNSILTNVSLFAAGAAIGSVVTWKLIKTKYEQIAQEEIDSVKERFSTSKSDEAPDTDEPIETAHELGSTRKPDIREYAAKLQEEGYSTDYASVTVTNSKKEVADVERPYTISPDESGELDDYELISLTYYADNVLADDLDELVEDVDEVVGLASLETFGEYEKDSVFVRNDKRKCDYEILRDARKYTDVVPLETE